MSHHSSSVELYSAPGVYFSDAGKISNFTANR